MADYTVAQLEEMGDPPWISMTKEGRMAIMDEIMAERRRQDAKWGEQSHGTGTRTGTGRRVTHRAIIFWGHGHETNGVMAGFGAQGVAERRLNCG